MSKILIIYFLSLKHKYGLFILILRYCGLRSEEAVALTIDDIDFSNPQSVFYFDNPFDVDFHTNYKYIQYLISRYKVDVLKS